MSRARVGEVLVVVGAVPSSAGERTAQALLRGNDGLGLEDFLPGVAAVTVGVDPVAELSLFFMV
jgi:hypothetical protein